MVDSEAFKTLGKRALYHHMTEAELMNDLMSMCAMAKGTEAEAFASKMLKRCKTRCFTHTSKYFICAIKGGMGRSEQAMSILKGSGHEKKTIRHFLICKLLMKHVQYDVDNYIIKATERLEKCIL